MAHYINLKRDTEVTCLRGGYFPTLTKVLPAGTRVFYNAREQTPGVMHHVIVYKDGRNTYTARCETTKK